MSISSVRRFAHVQDMDEAATSLVFHFGFAQRLQSQDAMALAISRLIEERVALVEGITDVRRWLLIIGKALQPGVALNYQFVMLAAAFTFCRCACCM